MEIPKSVLQYQTYIHVIAIYHETSHLQRADIFFAQRKPDTPPSSRVSTFGFPTNPKRPRSETQDCCYSPQGFPLPLLRLAGGASCWVFSAGVFPTAATSFRGMLSRMTLLTSVLCFTMAFKSSAVKAKGGKAATSASAGTDLSASCWFTHARALAAQDSKLFRILLQDSCTPSGTRSKCFCARCQTRPKDVALLQVLQRKVGPCKRPSCSAKSKPQIRQEYGLERAMTNTGGNRCRRLEQKKGCGCFHHTLCHQKKSVTFDFLRGQSADKTNKTFHPSADNGIFFSFYPLLPRTSLPMSVFPADNRGHPRTIRGHPVFSTFHTDASSPNGPWR